jgi:poly-beta-1,6-N-acetyl-D-glucosamine N-deacetylase
MNRRSLRNTTGWLAASMFRCTGAIERAHRTAMQNDCTLALYFHNPSADLFSCIIRWFQERRYHFLSLDELESCFKTNTPCPKGSVWISLDDAWRGNLTEVIPIIRGWNLPITMFVPTREVLRGTFWFSHACNNTAALPQPFRRDVQQLWRVPESTRRRVIEHLFEICPPSQREVISVAEIADLAKLPQVTIGSHSVNHALLPNCNDDELRKEISDSKRDLEQWTGRPVRVFSYPNGDFDKRTARVLAEAGYSLAFTTEEHPITVADNPYYLPRFSIMDDGSLTENICHAFGLWAPFIRAVKRFALIPNLDAARSTESCLPR